jgi:protease-4
MHSYNYRGLLDKVGVKPVVFKSGKFKDMLRGDKANNEIEPEEASMIQSLIDENYNRFKEVVSTGRKNAAKHNKAIGRTLVDNWEAYADGRIFSGKQAYELGFVDELGDFRVAVSRAKKLAGIKNAQLIRYDVMVNLSTLLRRLVGADIGHIRIDTGMNTMSLKTGRMYFLSEYLTP